MLESNEAQRGTTQRSSDLAVEKQLIKLNSR